MSKYLGILLITFSIFFSSLFKEIFAVEENFEQVTIELEKGDNLFRIFSKLKISQKESKIFIRSLERRIDLRRISVGQKINFYFEPKTRKLLVVSFPLKRNINVLAWKEKERINSARISESIAIDRIRAVFNMETYSAKPGKHSIRVRKGDNLTRILSNYGADLNEIHSIISVFSSVKNLKTLKPDDEITMFYSSGEDGVYLDKLLLVMSGEEIFVKKDAFGIFRLSNEFLSVNEKEESKKEFDTISGDNILGQLKDAGWTKKEAREAVNALATVYDPSQIQMEYKLIFPKDLRIRAFAFEIDRKFAILVTSIGKGKFLAKKDKLDVTRALMANLKYAEKIVMEEDLDAIETSKANLKNENIEDKDKDFDSKIEDEELEDFYVATNLVEGKILKGDSLLLRLYALGEKKKNIRRAITALSEVTNPNFIKSGSDFIVALGKDKEPMRGFYIGLNKKKGFLVVISEDNSYSSSKTTKKKALKILSKLKRKYIKLEEEKLEKWVNSSFVNNNIHNILSFTLKKGETLSHIFTKARIAENESVSIVNKLKNIYNPKDFYIGQNIKLAISKEGQPKLFGVIIELDKIRSIEIFNIEGNYQINRHKKKTFSKYHKNYGEVDTSLYMAAKEVGMPIPVLMDLVKVFSFDVDFQREVRRGDAFEVVYERKYISIDKPVNSGTVLRAALILGGEKITFYKFDDKYNGISDYFDSEGHSVRKALMRTPLDGARLTSGFGKRKHPILGYTKMHRGVDFGAPRNTPVYAAGDGIVEFLGRNGGYGKYILIRHNSDYKTAYAHLAKFAKFLTKRKRIKQGDIIGYVGSTGRSTGPHLHYEIIFRGKQVNPLTVRLPQGIRLSGKLYEKFSERRDFLDKLWNNL